MFSLRVQFKVKTSYGTPFLADTLFGHFCWALRYINGVGYLENLLANFESKPCLILSDAFPVWHVEEEKKYYIPMHVLSSSKKDYDDVKATIEQSSLINSQQARKKVEKLKFIEIEAFKKYAANLNRKNIIEDLFKLAICPLTMSINSQQCKSWTKCPGLIKQTSTDEHKQNCPEKLFGEREDLAIHNTINRLTNSTSGGNLFTSRDKHPSSNTGYYFLAKIDDNIIPKLCLKIVFSIYHTPECI